MTSTDPSPTGALSPAAARDITEDLMVDQAEKPKQGSIEDRQPMFRIVTYDEDGRKIDPWPDAPHMPHAPLSSLHKAGPLPSREVTS